MTTLERSVLATLCYFDLFDYPLTLAEVARYRYRLDPDDASAPSFSDVRSALAAAGAGSVAGYHFLPGREGIVSTRLLRYRLAEPKFRRARRAAAVMGRMPSVRFVGVCNSLAIANAGTESDIDLFVIVRDGTVWTTRLAVVSALEALGLRPTDGSHADKLCLSFFLSDRDLDLSRVAVGAEDPYLRYWIASLVPLHDDGVGEAFFSANRWIDDRVPSRHRRRARAAAGPFPGIGLFRAVEPHAERLQRRMFPEAIRRAENTDTCVVVGDDMLKFHVNDRRAEYERRFRERLRELGLAAADRPR